MTDVLMIDKARLKKFLSKKVHLRSGKGPGVNGAVDVNVVQAADWLVGGSGTSDSPACVDPAVRGLAICLNDSARFSQWRDELKPFAARIANTNHGPEFTAKRRWMLVDWAVRECAAPLAIEVYAKVAKNPARAEAIAQSLRHLKPIVDRATLLAARDKAREARDELRAAVAAYDAAAAAAYAAALAPHLGRFALDTRTFVRCDR
jgi:hypothetical protein